MPGLLLREVEQRTGIIRQFAACFVDHRNPELIEHTLQELVAQRIYGLALGYEDLNDHDQLRRDPLLATRMARRYMAISDPGFTELPIQPISPNRAIGFTGQRSTTRE